MYNIFIYYTGEGDYKGQLVNYFSGIDTIRITKTKVKFLMNKLWVTYHYNNLLKIEIVKIDNTLLPDIKEVKQNTNMISWIDSYKEYLNTLSIDGVLDEFRYMVEIKESQPKYHYKIRIRLILKRLKEYADM